MVIDVSVIIIAVAVVVLVTFVVMTLLKTQKTLDSAKKDLHSVSTEAIELMIKLEALTTDIKSKADSLNFVFRPLKALNREKTHRESSDTVTEVVEWVATSLVLFDKLKAVVKHYAK